MTGTPASQLSSGDLRAKLDELFYYHTIDVTPTVATKGWFDLRHALPSLPFPDLHGKRCLDIGTWDGFYAFEMERRGAAEVVAIDVPDLGEIDYPPEIRADPNYDHSRSDLKERSAGFKLLHELLGSKVEWRGVNVYDLDPDELGTFDFVVLGSLLVHLRDPVRALDRVRTVTKGQLLCVDFVHTPVQLLARRGRPIFELQGTSDDFQWWLASDAGLQRLLHVAGFTIEETSDFFLLRPGKAVDFKAKVSRRVQLARQLGAWWLTRDRTAGGHVHRGYLAHPRF